MSMRFLGVTSSSRVVPVGGGAVFPLDDDGTAVAAFGYNLLTVDPSTQQTGTLVFPGTTPDYMAVAADPLATGLLPLQPGIMCLGVVFNDLPLTDTYNMSMGFISTDSATYQDVAFIQASRDAGTSVIGAAAVDQLLPGDYDRTTFTPYGPFGDGLEAGLYINGTTGQVGWSLNGVDQGYFAGIDLSGRPGIAPYLVIEGSASNPVGDTGQLTLKTSGLSASAYPVGAVDIDGNPL